MQRFFDRLQRFSIFLVLVAAALMVSWLLVLNPGSVFLWVVGILFGALVLLGIRDLLQPQHTLMRNYPVIAHFRWLFEDLRPFLRQYIVEDNLEGRPFDRNMRSLVYQRAKNANDAQPYGTELNLYHPHYALTAHSIAPKPVPDPHFRVTIGSSQCRRPYSASLLNVSAMSFGSLSGAAIEALNLGALKGNFYQDTGEGGISVYHRRHGGDLVWEIGTGYFGCRDSDGRFDRDLFIQQANSDQVKMVEIKLSQGAKPGHGGMLPAPKVTPEIARARRIPAYEESKSPPYHTTFDTPKGLLEWAAQLREDCGGKPVGIKLCVGHPWEVLAICKAMLETGIRLDFIVVDGGEGGTGAAPEELSDHLGLPLKEGLVMVRNALVGTGLRQEVSLAASGKVYSAFSLATNLALGADWCNAARAFMLTAGCVMTKKCHTDKCPTGVATQNPSRQRGLVIEDKAPRAANFHANTLNHFAELLSATGVESPSQLGPHHFYQRLSEAKMVPFDDTYKLLEPNSLLDDPDSTPYREWWRAADADSFVARNNLGVR